MFIAVHPDDSMFDGTCGIPRDKWLRELPEAWDRAGEVERNGIMRYAKFFKSSERLLEMEKYGAISPTAGVVVKAGVSTGERIDAAIKNMKDWTEEDFWNKLNFEQSAIRLISESSPSSIKSSHVSAGSGDTAIAAAMGFTQPRSPATVIPALVS